MSDSHKKYFQHSLVFNNADFEQDIKEITKNLGYQKFQKLTDYQNIKDSAKDAYHELQSRNIKEQQSLVEKDGVRIMDALLVIVDSCHARSELMQVILPTVDGILADNSKNAALFRKIEDKSAFRSFSNILIERNLHQICYESAARICAVIAGDCDRKDRKNEKIVKNQTDLITQLIQLSKNTTDGQPRIGQYMFAASIVQLIKHDHLLLHFIKQGGIDILADNLRSNQLQTLYYSLLALWLCSFNSHSFPHFKSKKILNQMGDVIQRISREKLARVAFATFKNLCDKFPESIEDMIDAKLQKSVETLLKGTIKDKECLADIEYVGDILDKNLRILSSFEKYEKELTLKSLQDGPVHSEKFWREHVKQFEKNNFQHIQEIANLLEDYNKIKNVDNPNSEELQYLKNTAIACHDLGEFCRFHPYGKHVIEKLNAKAFIIKYANSSNQMLKENALLALQKIMLHNWQAIGK